MNKNNAKGVIDENVGSAKRHLGNLSGNTRTQVEGAVQELKGKAETAIGNLKDAVRDAKDDALAQRKRNEEVDRERHAANRVENRNLL
jgi:uncharacterized protein YjbJ (UPF0337 family)